MSGGDRNIAAVQGNQNLRTMIEMQQKISNNIAGVPKTQTFNLVNLMQTTA